MVLWFEFYYQHDYLIFSLHNNNYVIISHPPDKNKKSLSPGQTSLQIKKVLFTS